METQNINDLLHKLKADKPEITIQKVTPIKINKREEVQFSFYLSKPLLKKIKQKALDENESIKNVINEALQLYLKTN